MPSPEGPKSPGTLVNDATVGTVDWTNPSNAASSDNLYASVIDINLQTTKYLKATAFGFSIPAGSTIDGIVMEFERQMDHNGCVEDNSIRLVKNGTISGDDKETGGNCWPSSDAYATYGSSTDKWGLTWTATDINASTFGVAISGIEVDGTDSSGHIDHIRITVYYTAEAGGDLLIVFIKRFFPELYKKWFQRKQTRTLNPVFI